MRAISVLDSKKESVMSEKKMTADQVIHTILTEIGLPVTRDHTALLEEKTREELDLTLAGLNSEEPLIQEGMKIGVRKWIESRAGKTAALAIRDATKTSPVQSRGKLDNYRPFNQRGMPVLNKKK